MIISISLISVNSEIKELFVTSSEKESINTFDLK